MVTVSFTENLQKHLRCDAVTVKPGTLDEVLAQVFEDYPSLAGYVLDDQGELRKHVMLAIDQQLVQGALPRGQRLDQGSRLHIMQALSGG
ncbi:hypothetical protein BGP77_02585 [Saccharospirillum sp. MSK14-1]|uniref:MoaD/ThiS family protein n=1 Tax=Saccharospirillum sp. MSK14-1 TaxID=1897632 RepID=UPI000D3CBE08|nr:MoaD/ThiS family protein [Saccharospirillum sp. MSK14-1]PTY36216.1 hypothetical protein BGP77_02585 [Saccharospirillum sp. MSK14-1]